MRALTVIETVVNIRGIAAWLAVWGGILACSERVVNLDARVIESSGKPDVLAIVHERIEKLAVDEQRLYWLGTRFSQDRAERPWSLRSCQKRDCASTLITYDEGSSSSRHDFTVEGGQLYWYREDGLLSCAATGCDGAPRLLARLQPITAQAFGGGYIYLADRLTIYRLSLSQSALREPVAVSPSGVLAIVVRGADVYWLAQNPQHENKSNLLRTRADGSSTIDTIFTQQNISLYNTFALTTDNTSMYWTNNVLAGSINRCSLDHCVVDWETLVGRLRAPQNLLIDGARLYYQYEVAPYNYAISSCALPTCVPSTPLQEHLDAPNVLALDDHYLYVPSTEQDVGPNSLDEDIIARIRRLPKPDGASP